MSGSNDQYAHAAPDQEVAFPADFSEAPMSIRGGYPDIELGRVKPAGPVVDLSKPQSYDIGPLPNSKLPVRGYRVGGGASRT